MTMREKMIERCLIIRHAFLTRHVWLEWCKLSYGFTEDDLDCLMILDCHYEEGKAVLLDGYGEYLPAGASPVWRRFRRGEVQRNSRGEPYSPQATFEERCDAIGEIRGTDRANGPDGDGGQPGGAG